jgi:hypothetical protein
MAALMLYVANLIGSFGFLLCFVGVFFTLFYSNTVQGHICGQLSRGWAANSEQSGSGR